MNYKNAGIAEIEVLGDTFDKYSLGQILLAIIHRKPEEVSLNEWLYNIKDEDLYTEIEKTKLIELEDENIG